MNIFSSRPQSYIVHTDGATRLERGVSGLAAIVRDEKGKIIHWWCRRDKRMTCNEAEYAAAIMAFEFLRTLHTNPREVKLFSDSQVMVHQMSGLASARAPALRQAQMRLRGLIVQFEKVTFHHIPREKNRLADALANDAADGKEPNERIT
jgi:ribonuclease HI